MSIILVILELVHVMEDPGLTNFKWPLEQIQIIRKKRGEGDLKKKREKEKEDEQVGEGSRQSEVLISILLGELAKEPGIVHHLPIIESYMSTLVLPPSCEASVLSVERPSVLELISVLALDLDSLPVLKKPFVPHISNTLYAIFRHPQLNTFRGKTL